MGQDERMASWHLVAPDGSVTSAGSAAPALLRLLPAGHIPARIAARLEGIVERGYWWVARHRGALGRMVTRGAIARADRVIARRASDLR
jgi:hypothetical protein